ncbi:MAG: amidohydrolase [Candidatus Tectimicrobiota bacterium]|nr:MAG: amidohydrolase [Candidatus Tectomicrobia bacterium]
MEADELHQQVAELREAVVALRRELHRWPELGFQEEKTAARVAAELRHLGLDVRTGVGKTGVVGVLRGARPGKTVLLRADMDALPLQEATGAPYASENPGVMHACGHDGHTAILLTVARLLAARREALPGTVKFVFQPAEELPPGGAQAMIAEGVLEDPPVDAAFALHLWNSLPVGQIGVSAGPIMASADRFQIRIKGVGSHGAYPHLGVDPIVVGSHLVSALQTLVSRELPPLTPAVVTVGKFHAGTAFNVIPSEAELAGTVRTVDAAVRQEMPARLERLVRGLAAAMRAESEVTYTFGYPVTVNDAKMAALAAQVARQVVGEANVVAPQMSMGAEDFAYFLEAVPGCYLRLGSGNAARGLVQPHHSALFDFDEAALPIGVEVLARLALAFLHQET